MDTFYFECSKMISERQYWEIFFQDNLGTYFVRLAIFWTVENRYRRTPRISPPLRISPQSIRPKIRYIHRKWQERGVNQIMLGETFCVFV